MDFAAKHNIITMDKRIDKSLCHSSFSIIRLVYTILCLFDKSLRKESKVVQTKKQYGDFSLTALSFASISIFSG